MVLLPFMYFLLIELSYSHVTKDEVICNHSNCLQCIKENIFCEWSNEYQQCSKLQSISSQNYKENWYDYYSICLNDEKTKKNLLKYCGNTGNYFPFELLIHTNLINDNSKENIYCQWSVFFNDKEDIEFKIDINNTISSQSSLILFFENEKDEIMDILEGGYHQKRKKLKGFKFLYLGLNIDKTSTPFNFIINKSNSFKGVYIVIIIFGIVFIGIIVFGCFIRRKTLKINAPINQPEVIQTHKNAVIEELTIPVSFGSIVNNTKNVCMICLDTLNNETMVCLLPCSDIFHPECLKEWLRQSKKELTCPNCKMKLAFLRNGLYFINKKEMEPEEKDSF